MAEEKNKKVQKVGRLELDEKGNIIRIVPKEPTKKSSKRQTPKKKKAPQKKRKMGKTILTVLTITSILGYLTYTKTKRNSPPPYIPKVAIHMLNKGRDAYSKKLTNLDEIPPVIERTISNEEPKTFASGEAVKEFYERAKSYGDIFERAGKLHNIPSSYLMAIASVESGVGVGFTGHEPNIFQITPIAKEEIESRYRKIDVYNPWDNADGAAFLLEHYRKILLDNYKPKSKEEEFRLLALSYRYGVYGVLDGVNYAKKHAEKKNDKFIENVKRYLDKLYSNEPIPPSKENYDEKVWELYEKFNFIQSHTSR